MADWLGWFGLAGILLVFEMFTGTFYLLMIALGVAAGGVAALAGIDEASQLAVAAIVGMVATFALRRSKWGRTAWRSAESAPDVNLDIGQTLVVDAWDGAEGGTRTARAMYRGALWDVELEAGSAAQPGVFVIREVRGSRLIVGSSGST